SCSHHPARSLITQLPELTQFVRTRSAHELLARRASERIHALIYLSERDLMRIAREGFAPLADAPDRALFGPVTKSILSLARRANNSSILGGIELFRCELSGRAAAEEH